MKITPIDKLDDRSIRIHGTQGFHHAADQNVCSVVAPEIAQAALNFPIAFIKEPNSGRLMCSALLGLSDRKNLFIDGDSWLSTYIPMNVKRAPFLIGPSADDENSLCACVDLDSNYISHEAGEALFDDKGEKTDFLKRAEEFIAQLYDYEVATQHFVNRLSELDLLIPFTVEFLSATGKGSVMKGLYTVSEEKLKELSDEHVLELFRKGYMTAIDAQMASLGQVNRLASLVNQRNEGDARIAGARIQLETS